MPRYSEEDTKEDVEKKSKRACKGLSEDLLECLWESDCVRKLKMTPRECIQDYGPSVPDKCKSLHKAFYECKISMIDMRARFRGIKGY